MLERTDTIDKQGSEEPSEKRPRDQPPSDTFAITTDASEFQHIPEFQQGQSKRSEMTVNESQESRRRRIHASAKELQTMYCPCAGFSYNSLSTRRNVLVSCQLRRLGMHAEASAIVQAPARCGNC